MKNFDTVVDWLGLIALTWVFGWWYLLAAVVAFGYWKDFSIAVAWPYNLGEEIGRHVRGEFQ